MILSVRSESSPDDVSDTQGVRGNGQRGIDTAARWEKRGIGDVEICKATHFILRR
jgi:hypothetical protein